MEIETDGRQLTFLLVSLHELGYALHVVKSPMLFRELKKLRKSAPLPFIVGGKERRCDLFISDCKERVERASLQGIRSIYLDPDFFTSGRSEVRMPYFMHPSVYHAGWHHLPSTAVQQVRKARVGFFGTRDAVFYTENFRFPMMNREEILKFFFEEYGNRITTVRKPPSEWVKTEILVSVDTKGGDWDRHPKSFLPQKDYLQALRSSDFFLSAPGCWMPLSHNLIEGMAAGSIPIVNIDEYLDPPLIHGENCLSFRDPEGLKAAINNALAMDQDRIMDMRHAVLQYYQEHLAPEKWVRDFFGKKPSKKSILLVNAEEVSSNKKL